MKRTITGNRVLFRREIYLESGVALSLHQQSYSDGTRHYTLQDDHGQWRVEHGSNNLEDLVKQMRLEIAVDHKYLDMCKSWGNAPSIVIDTCRKVIAWHESILHSLEQIIAE